MMTIDKPSCATCAFWLKLKQADPTGLCKRYPPAIVGMGPAKFPATHHGTWCGEWRPDFGEATRDCAREEGEK